MHTKTYAHIDIYVDLSIHNIFIHIYTYTYEYNI